MGSKLSISEYEKELKEILGAHMVNRTDDSITVQYNKNDDTGTIKRVDLFPGIHLYFFDIEANSFHDLNNDDPKQLQILFCIEGKCEIRMSNGTHLLLNTGDLSFIRHICADFSFHCGRFRGMELCVVNFVTDQNTLSIFRNFEIDFNSFLEKLSEDNNDFVLKATKEINSIVMIVWQSFLKCNK
jgi:hypothetical protein